VEGAGDLALAADVLAGERLHVDRRRDAQERVVVRALPGRSG
jgi:hypothetical protein